MPEQITEKMRQGWREKLETISKSYDYGCINLNDWEKQFLNSIDGALNEGKDLSWKQYKCLNKIYEKC